MQVLDSDWFKTDHRAVLAVLSLKRKMKYTMGNGANLRGWEPDDSWHSGCRDDDGVGELECDGAFAYGNGEDTQEIGNQGDDSDRI